MTMRADGSIKGMCNINAGISKRSIQMVDGVLVVKLEENYAED